MMKTTRIILLLMLMVGATQWMNAQVKIGERPLDIGNERLLEMERAGELFIVTDSLEIGITTSTTTNVPGTDALMMKLYGYGLGNFQAAQTWFLGTNTLGEVLEFPLTLDLLTNSTTATLSLNNGSTLFGDVNLNNLDSVFSTNNQLVDSVNSIRTLINDLAAEVDSDLDTIQINELIDEIVMADNVFDMRQTVLRIYENQYVHDSLRDVSEIDLDPYFATDVQLADTAQALRDLIFYKIDGTLDEDRTLTGLANSLTFTDVDSFNVNSVNTTLTSSANTNISAGGDVDITATNTTSVTADQEVTISSVNSDIIIDASTDSISMIGTIRLDEYPSKPPEAMFSNILGIDAAGNMINISASSILGTEEDSTIYRHNGTLTDERFMTMAGHDLNFVGTTAADSVVITADGRILIGRGTVTSGSTANGIRLDVNGDILAIQVHSSSDERFKKNIAPIQSALDKVMSIEGVTYDFRIEEFADRNFPKTKQLGFIAQNVEAVLPEVVRTNGDGYKAVDYSKITALLNEAVKEQQAQIQAQRQVIEAQEKMLTSLTEDFSGLSSQVASLKNQLKGLSNQTMSED